VAITKEEMATKIDVTDWFSLRAHLERGGIIVVDPLLDLAEVGIGVVADDVKSVERWVSSGLLGKPTVQQIATWDANQGSSFLCLIVSPYVLIQEHAPQH
jgi:hypothetical protein